MVNLTSLSYADALYQVVQAVDGGKERIGRLPGKQVFYIIDIGVVAQDYDLFSIVFWNLLVARRHAGVADRQGNRHPIPPVRAETLEGVDEVAVADR